MLPIWLRRTGVIRKLGFTLGAGITVTMVILSWLGPGFLVRLENTSLDFRFKLRGKRNVGSEIVLVAVDEKSLQELGRWPWSREKQARLLRTIAADGPKVIALDILYAEQEVSDYRQDVEDNGAAAGSTGAAPQDTREHLSDTAGIGQSDRRLQKSLQSATNVILALPFVVPKSDAQAEIETPTIAPEYLTRSEFMLVRQSRSGESLEPLRATNVRAPLKLFADHAASLGHVYSLPDPDGITRYEYLALRYEDGYYSSFALETARLYFDVPKDRMALILGEGVDLGERLIPTDQKERLLINYVGPERSFPYVSATDVIHQRVPVGTFRSKAVLVGTAALGTYDQKATPFSANFPGVEKNATVVENILHGNFVKKTLWVGPVDVSVILLFGLGLAYALPRIHALPGTLLAGTALLGCLSLAQYLFVRQGIWLDVVTPTVTIAATFVTITVLRFIIEEQQAREIRALFSSYVSPQIVEELIKDPTKATLGGQRKELTMLFSDVAGFTAFSEKHSAEEVVAQLNEYLAVMTEVIFRWNGTLDKFVGDAIVVFWGAPLDQPNHVESAIKCALHMRKRLAELQAKWKAEGRVPFDIGIGINTGFALVGNIGAEGKKMDYTMIGDHVNLAARAEGLTREFHCPIVVTEFTAARLRELIVVEERGDNQDRLGHVSLRRLGATKVKGKEHPVIVYALESLERQETSRIEELPSPELLELKDRNQAIPSPDA